MARGGGGLNIMRRTIDSWPDAASGVACYTADFEFSGESHPRQLNRSACVFGAPFLIEAPRCAYTLAIYRIRAKFRRYRQIGATSQFAPLLLGLEACAIYLIAASILR